MFMILDFDMDTRPPACSFAEDSAPSNCGIWVSSGFRMNEIHEIMEQAKMLHEQKKGLFKKWMIFTLDGNTMIKSWIVDTYHDIFMYCYEETDIFPRAKQDSIRFVIQLEWYPYEPIKLDLTQDVDDIFQ
jgi:hypothetical protein